MGKHVDALENSKKVHEVGSNVALYFADCVGVKEMIHKNVDALEDFSKAHEVEPNRLSCTCIYFT